MLTFYKTLEVLIPILLGLSFRLCGVFGDQEGDVLRSFVVRICVPLLVFFSMYDSSPETVRALPIMMGAFVLLAESYEMDLDLVTTCIIISTILSMVTVPGIAVLLLG